MQNTKEAQRKYREKNKDRLLAYRRDWHKKHPEKQKEYETHRDEEHRKQTQKEYRKKHKEHYAELQRQGNDRRRKEARSYIVNSLGAKCRRCGITDIRILQIHHKNGGGNQERRKYDKDGKTNDYRYLKQLGGKLDIIELLCANCHIIESWYT